MATFYIVIKNPETKEFEFKSKINVNTTNDMEPEEFNSIESAIREYGFQIETNGRLNVMIVEKVFLKVNTNIERII